MYVICNRVSVNLKPVLNVEHNNRSFYVQSYTLWNNFLELTGYYGHYINASSSLSREKNVIRLEGIAALLKDIKSTLVQDEKIEKAVLPFEKFFRISRQSKEVTCSKLFRGEKTEQERARKMLNATQEIPDKISEEGYVNITTNCSKFTHDRGYILNPLTTEEKQFPIAFSILMFKDTWQFERLLRAIYRPQNLYCIHVDGKSREDIFKAVSGISRCLDNVFLSSKRFKVYWGQMTVLEPELTCMQDLWNRSKTWKYFINLTGQEFPLRTNYELVKILMAYNGANDIDGSSKRVNKDRWSSVGPSPHDLTPMKGPVHIVASRGYVGFILHDSRAKDLLNWTRFTKVPDETFFATLNNNPSLTVPGSYRGLPENHTNAKPRSAVRFKNWGGLPCAGKLVRVICIFGIGDLPVLAQRKELFANKFHQDFQRFTYDCMEELHYNRTRDQYLGRLEFDSRWYSKLGFVMN